MGSCNDNDKLPKVSKLQQEPKEYTAAELAAHREECNHARTSRMDAEDKIATMQMKSPHKTD